MQHDQRKALNQRSRKLMVGRLEVGYLQRRLHNRDIHRTSCAIRSNRYHDLNAEVHSIHIPSLGYSNFCKSSGETKSPDQSTMGWLLFWIRHINRHNRFVAITSVDSVTMTNKLTVSPTPPRRSERGLRLKRRQDKRLAGFFLPRAKGASATLMTLQGT